MKSGYSSSLESRLREHFDSLSPAGQRVAAYLIDHLSDALFGSAEEIATATETSDATVVRTAQALGYSGLADLKRDARAEVIRLRSPTERLAQRLQSTGERPSDHVRQLAADAGESLDQTQAELTDEALHRAGTLLSNARFILTYGLGTSATVASYLALMLGRTGLLTRAASSHGLYFSDDLLGLRKGDCVVLFAPGRQSSDLDFVVSDCEKHNIDTILVTSTLHKAYEGRVSLVLTSTVVGSGVLNEVLPEIFVCDALITQVAATDSTRALATSQRLTELRNGLSY